MAKGERNGNWRGGTSEYPNHYIMKQIRLEVLEEANHICQRCGGIATEIHHLDKTKTNHTKENFMPVCHKCNISFHLDVIGRPKGQSKFISFVPQIIHLYLDEKLNCRQIALFFKCSSSTIWLILREKNLLLPYRKRLPEDIELKICADYQLKNMNLNKLKNLYPYGYHVIRRILNKYGIPVIQGCPHKFTPEQVQEITQLYLKGSTQKQLANDYGCSKPTIGSVVNKYYRQV